MEHIYTSSPKPCQETPVQRAKATIARSVHAIFPTKSRYDRAKNGEPCKGIHRGSGDRAPINDDLRRIKCTNGGYDGYVSPCFRPFYSPLSGAQKSR